MGETHGEGFIVSGWRWMGGVEVDVVVGALLRFAMLGASELGNGEPAVLDLLRRHFPTQPPTDIHSSRPVIRAGLRQRLPSANPPEHLNKTPQSLLLLRMPTIPSRSTRTRALQR
jgi:hypothetical protein